MEYFYGILQCAMFVMHKFHENQTNTEGVPSNAIG